MRHILVLVGLAGLMALFVPAQARPDSAPPCAANPIGGAPPVLGATVFSNLTYLVPTGVGSTSGAATLPLSPSWSVFFGNGTATTVTNPTLTISSTLDPSLFNGLPTASLPSSCSLPSLDPGHGMHLGFAGPGAAVNRSLGFDTTASATPDVVPAAGGELTEQFTVTVTNAQLAGGGISLSIGNGDISVISQTNPQNLGQGESVSNDGSGDWTLNDAQLNKTYVFSALVSVGNAGPQSAPYVFSPNGLIDVGRSGGCDICGHETGPSVTIPDTTLQGAFDFSVDQAGEDWNVFHATLLGAFYQENGSPLECKKGSWSLYGIFKNQGDCVSYVASGGKNMPGN